REHLALEQIADEADRKARAGLGGRHRGLGTLGAEATQIEPAEQRRRSIHARAEDLVEERAQRFRDALQLTRKEEQLGRTLEAPGSEELYLQLHDAAVKL